MRISNTIIKYKKSTNVANSQSRKSFTLSEYYTNTEGNFFSEDNLPAAVPLQAATSLMYANSCDESP